MLNFRGFQRPEQVKVSSILREKNIILCEKCIFYTLNNFVTLEIYFWMPVGWKSYFKKPLKAFLCRLNYLSILFCVNIFSFWCFYVLLFLHCGFKRCYKNKVSSFFPSELKLMWESWYFLSLYWYLIPPLTQ